MNIKALRQAKADNDAAQARLKAEGRKLMGVTATERTDDQNARLTAIDGELETLTASAATVANDLARAERYAEEERSQSNTDAVIVGKDRALDREVTLGEVMQAMVYASPSFPAHRKSVILPKGIAPHVAAFLADQDGALHAAASGASSGVPGIRRRAGAQRLEHLAARARAGSRQARAEVLLDADRRRQGRRRSAVRRRDQPRHRLALGRRAGLPRRGSGGHDRLAAEARQVRAAARGHHRSVLRDRPRAARCEPARSARDEGVRVRVRVQAGRRNHPRHRRRPVSRHRRQRADRVRREGNQPGAATIVFENIIKMYSTLLASCMPGAEWYINQTCLPQLFKMYKAVGTGGVPVYLPANGLSASPYGTLMGLPVNVIEQASAVGTVGDIILANFSNDYALISKPMAQASSIHVLFTSNQTTFRWVWPIIGKPVRSAAVTPYKGSGTFGPFVTLATRA
jgi:hypothetical protein